MGFQKIFCSIWNVLFLSEFSFSFLVIFSTRVHSSNQILYQVPLYCSVLYLFPALDASVRVSFFQVAEKSDVFLSCSSPVKKIQIIFV